MDATTLNDDDVINYSQAAGVFAACYREKGIKGKFSCFEEKGIANNYYCYLKNNLFACLKKVDQEEQLTIKRNSDQLAISVESGCKRP